MLNLSNHKLAITIVFILVFTAVFTLVFSKLISGFGSVETKTISGVWHAQYTLYTGNLAYFGLQNPKVDGLQLACEEELTLLPMGAFNQIIKCDHGTVTLQASGQWNIQDINHDKVIKLFNMRYLFPRVDLQGLSSVDSDFRQPNPIYVTAPLNSDYFDRWFSGAGVSVGEQYAYSNNGFVLLFPRRRISDGKKVLAHGIIIDESPVEYMQ